MRFCCKLFLFSLLVKSQAALAGTTIFSEGFEEPELTVENFSNFNGLWVVFGAPTSSFDAPAEVPVATTFIGDSGETWRITKGNIDIVDGVGLSQGGFAAASGTQSIDLNGFEPGAFEVTVGFPAPGLYNLSFAMSRNPNAPSNSVMKVMFDGESLDGSPYTVTQTPTASEMNYQQVPIQFYVSTAGSHTLAFESLDQVNAQGRNGYGVVIDDVEITSVLTPLTYDIRFTSETTVLNATIGGDQINPSIASLPGNQFVMTWSDRASLDGDRGGILGRLYDGRMTPLTSEFVVNTLTADWQSKSNVASAPNGTFMAIWHQSNGWVEGQLFDALGEKQGPQFTVQEGFNGLSDVVADAQGNFWVVSSVNNGSGYVSKYSNTGELLVDSLVLPSEGVASDPVITALSDGSILVGWHDGQNPSGSDVYGQFITADGQLSGSPFVVNTTLAENQSKSAIAALSSGGFVVTWQSLLQDGDLGGVYARVFDAAGEGGSEILVNTNTTGNQVGTYVTARSDGGFVVGWADAAAVPQGQVYLQSYTASGESQGGNQLVSVDDVTTINNSVNIELAELTDGSLVAVWNAWKGSQNIYGRTFKLLTITETDTDGDGFPDDEDAFPNDPSETTDTDGDGVGDNADAFPIDASETTDSDADGVGDNADAFPNDPSETADTDGDGIGNNADNDDDGDGYSDSDELEAGTDSLSPESFPSEDLPIWLLYIATEPKAA